MVDEKDQEACTPKCTPGGDNESQLFKGNLEVHIGRKENRHNLQHKTMLKSLVKPKIQNKFRIAPRRG